MRVLLWGTYDTSKPRSRILRAGLRTAGLVVEEIHTDVWGGVEDKSQVKGLGARLRLLARWILAYPRLTWRLLRTPKPDLLLIGYPGVLDAFIATFIGRLRHIPVAWDVFISLYDTVVEDRKMIRPQTLTAKVLHALERCALQRVDLAFMDTAAHARRIETLFGLATQSCGAIWVGSETEHFAHIDAPPLRPPEASLKVLFYGQFIPLHGIPTIVEAARLLRDAPVEWTLIGRGQEAERIRAMLAEDPLQKLQWIEWVDYNKLRDQIVAADLCLGIFGESDKAASVIPNKVFQILAAGRPLVTRDSPAIRELLHPSLGCVYLVPEGNSARLAEAVHTHLENWNWRQGHSCHSDVLGLIDKRAIGMQFLDLISRANLGCGAK